MRRWAVRCLVGSVVGLWAAAGAAGSVGLLLGGPWHWDEFAVRLLLLTVLQPPAWALGEWLARRIHPAHPVRLRREAARELVGPALRTGRVPVGADPARWARALDNVDRDLGGMVPVVACGGVVVAVLVGGAAVRLDPADVGIWTVTVAVLASTAVGLRFLRRERAALQRLRARVPAPD